MPNKPPKRIRNTIKIPKSSHLKGLDNYGVEDLQYWRIFLKKSMDRKDNTALYIDPRCVKGVEAAVKDAIRIAQDQLWKSSQNIFNIRNGELAGGVWRQLYPTVTSSPRFDLQVTSDHLVWNRKFWAEQSAYRARPRAPERREPLTPEILDREGIYRWYVKGGTCSTNITHQGGRTKVWITPTTLGPDYFEPLSNRIPAAWRTTQGSWPRFLRSIPDDDLVQLWMEFRTSREIRAELVRRAGDIQTIHSVKFSYRNLLRIRDAELRRAIVGFAEVNWPEPFAVDDDGELIAFDAFINILRVTCPSTGRVYHLGVPKDTHQRRRTWDGSPGVVTTPGIELDTPRKARMWTLRLNHDTSGEPVKLKEEA